MNPLLHYASSQVVPAKADRPIAQRAKTVVAEVRHSGLKVDGAIALASHVMDLVIDLDHRRRVLSNGDPLLNEILGEIEGMAVRQARLIQTDLFADWRL
jgi:hypothetical protein